MDIFDLALTMTPGVGSVTAAHLIDSCFSAERVFSLSIEELVHNHGITSKQAQAIVSRTAFVTAEREMKYCEAHDISMISRMDIEYPIPLRGIYNPPHVLFVQGDRSIFTRNLISMVGTRGAGNYGMMACNSIVEGLANKLHNPVIVSGLAFGADSFAHRAALSNNIPTVAVIPAPLPNILPSSHRDLSERIVKQGGALISELCSYQTGAGKAYLSRNRIIAGISQGTILIESGASGGAMRTMELAGTMQHQQMAIPGRIGDENSVGCNRLISTGEAALVSSAEDVIRVLGWEERRKIKQLSQDIDEVAKAVDRVEEGGASDFDYSLLSEAHRAILLNMTTTEPIHISALERMNPMSAHLLNGLLVEMEIFGAINSLPGSLYQRAVPMRGLKAER